ncbi:MAG: polysaccharide deacetylase family protein [Marinilabilia sp.]
MKKIILYICRYLGLFWISRVLYRKKLLILCYHGVSVRDEHLWWPGVFMTEEKFANRLALLKRYRYNVLDLESAVDALNKNRLPPNTVVLTADDGYLNSPGTMVKQCERYGFPLTIYVTSYYSRKSNPVFNVMVQYLFWKTDKKSLVGEFPFADKLGARHWSLEGDQARILANQIIDFGREHCNEDQRRSLLVVLCEALGMDFNEMEALGMFMLMGPEEITGLSEKGVDIQLHTHRHRFPVDETIAKREITENRDYLEPLVGRKLVHFCYPSGRWDLAHHPWLKSLDVKSAVTLEIGFNSAGANPLALRRYLDKQDIPEIQFLAEVSGFADLARKMRRKVKLLWR